MTDFDSMHISIKLENEDTSYFAELKALNPEYKQNAKIDKGCVLKLSELPKENLLDILNRFKVDHLQKENRAQ